MTLLLAAVLAGSSLPPPCEIDECLRRIGRLAHVELVHPDPYTLTGHWTQGPGLTGAELYLFPDATYIYTEWGCVEPETIHDKGNWRLNGDVVVFTADADVTWA